MIQIKSYLLLCVFVCHTAILFAQFDNVSFDRVSAKYGLPNGYIKDIFEDHYGFLWFGTREGLFRYDGYEFKAYRHDVKDSTTLSNPNINMVAEDMEGGMWVGTNNGLNLLDLRTGKSHRFLPAPRNETTSKINNLIRKVFEDSRGNLWLASISKTNMVRFDKHSKTFIATHQANNPEGQHFVRCYFEDAKGQIWAGANNGLLKLNPGDSTFQHVLPDPDPHSENNQIIAGICESEDGSLWLATKAGLINWNPKTSELKKDFLPAELRNIQINFITPDQKGNLWLALNNNGLVVFDPKENRYNHFVYQTNQTKSLNNNIVTCILEDRFQNIWVGTESGISKIRLDNSGFQLFFNEAGDGNISNNIARVMRDSRGTIWSKTPHGIYSIEKGKTKGKRIEELSKNNQGIGWDWFLEDYMGGIWLSISDDGIYRQKKGDNIFRKMPFGDTLSKVGIFKMVIDAKDPHVFWIGTTVGLCRLNWKTLEKHWYRPMDDIPEISSDRFTIFEQYGEDEIWLYYTYSNSLGRFDKNTKKFELFLPDPANKAVLEGDIKDIAIGKDGNIWIASLYGLTNFNTHTKEFGIFGKKEGLLENELQSVLIDKKDRIWVSGNRFFARFDQSENTFENYLISKEILQFQSKSKHVAEDGSILLGSINGIYTFHPDKIYKNQKAPNVVLTDFKVKNESYLLDQSYGNTTGIILSHNENDISFEFSGLHYINPEANNYKCKLTGLDNQWRDLGNEHKVSYTNLNPGSYIFQAIASNSDGVWNEKGLNIQLTISPAFWQTLWFESLIVLVLLSIGYALFKNRQHQLALKRQKEIAEQSAEYKTRFLADISHEIRTPMNAIIGLSKLALDTELNEKQFKFISAIKQSSKNLLTIINDLLDHTKLESGKFTFVNRVFNVSDTIEQLNDIFKHKAEENNLALVLKLDPNIPKELTGDPLRLNQILTNLLGNALKFTDQGKIWLNVEKTHESEQKVKLKFEVGDTGIGIAKEQLDFIFESFNQADNEKTYEVEGTGLGLSITRQLVERQGGQLFIESELGKGTTLWFELNFGKSILKRNAEKLKDDQFIITALNILVVEDNHFNQLVIMEILEKYISKAKIEIAENGKIALDKLDKQLFDIIIMDVKMPILDGYETTKIIRSSDNINLKKIPILAVTANALPEQLQKCKEVGMNDFVTKPIDEIELLEKIQALTKNQQLIDRNKLKQLLANDEKRVQQYLNIFKSQTPEQLKLIKDSFKDNDLEQVSITAHNIKSQCSFLGLEELSNIALNIEQLAESGNKTELIPDLIFQLEEKTNAVIQNELAVDSE